MVSFMVNLESSAHTRMRHHGLNGLLLLPINASGEHHKVGTSIRGVRKPKPRERKPWPKAAHIGPLCAFVYYHFLSRLALAPALTSLKYAVSWELHRDHWGTSHIQERWSGLWKQLQMRRFIPDCFIFLSARYFFFLPKFLSTFS